MSRVTRMGAAAGALTTLALALTGTAQAAAAVPGQETTAAPAAGEAAAAPCYVIAYQKKNFKGLSACLSSNYKNLASYSWPGSSVTMNDSISSIKVDKACRVQLFQAKDYAGAVSTWKRIAHLPGAMRSDPDLSNNPIGDNRTSSVKVYCAADV
jgi:hypothetical protein